MYVEIKDAVPFDLFKYFVHIVQSIKV